MERGLRGHLRLVCERDAAGRSVLREQSFAAPVHVGKSFQESGCCLLHVMNPTAGLLAGDRIDWDVKVRAGAKLILSGPSASRAHTMESGRAVFSQRFRVEDDAWLEINPSLFIPQRSARYVQETRIELAEKAGLLFLETLAPGRVASGEAFVFHELEWDTQVRWNGCLVLKERHRLEPNGSSLHALRTLWNPSYYASMIAFHPAIDLRNLRERVANLADQSVRAGASALRAGGVSMKVIAPDSPTLHRSVDKLRAIVYEEAGWPIPSLRR